MNNTQLDMVLDYLNEGVELDEFGYLSESITEMMTHAFTEGTMLQTLMEENEEAPKDDDKEDNAKKEDKVGFGTKVKATVDRFLNWIKKIITNIKGQLMKVSQKINATYTSMILKKAIKKVESSGTTNVKVGYNILLIAGQVEGFDKLEKIWKETFTLVSDELDEVTTKDISSKSMDEIKKWAGNMDDMLKEIMGDVDEDAAYKDGADRQESIDKKRLLDALKKLNGNSLYQGISYTQKTLDLYNLIYRKIANFRKDVNDPTKINIMLSALTKGINKLLKITNTVFKNTMKVIRDCKILSDSGNTDGKAENE